MRKGTYAFPHFDIWGRIIILIVTLTFIIRLLGNNEITNISRDAFQETKSIESM